MDRTLLDALRCPAAHAEEWLVAMVHATGASPAGPRLLEADLACPHCQRSYPVREGVAWFAGAPHATTASTVPPAPAAAEDAGVGDDRVHAERLAALLGVAEGPWPVVLVGTRAGQGAALARLVTPPQWWLNPPANSPQPAMLAGMLHVGARWPLAAQVAAAAAVDATHATPAALAEAVRVVRPGGRLVAPAHVPLPAGAREMARDAREWVAEVSAPLGGLVALRRRPT